MRIEHRLVEIMSAIKRDLSGELGNVKYSFIRRDPATMFADLPEWFKKLEVKEIVSVCQSVDNGNITLSLFYR